VQTQLVADNNIAGRLGHGVRVVRVG
jgi:hypothetical protein